MFENMTPEHIKNQMLQEITTVDTREGSYMNTLVSGVAYAIWELYQSLNAVVPIAFVDETSGEYIDRRAGEFGMTRKKGTQATATMGFTGKEGTLIPAGSVFLTADGFEYILVETVTIDETGTGQGTVSAAQEGESYNAPKGAITGQYKTIQGLTAAENTTAAVGGTEPETDASLVSRLYEFWRKPATSGNIYHYKQWAKEVDGVGEAKVFPLAFGNGTVHVVICSGENRAVSQETVDACRDHIAQVRPIGATVTVQSAVEQPIQVSATVKLDQSRTLEDVSKEIEERITSYLQEIAFHSTEVVYHQIAYLILGVSGVTDYTTLTINGGTENLTLAEHEIAVLGAVEVEKV